MDNILSHYIVNLLLTQGKAFLPRVGVLTLEDAAAEILPNLNMIRGPKKIINFGHSDRVDREDLLAQFQLWRDLDTASAKNLAQKFEEELYEQLLSGSMTIKDIGTFTNTETGIVFSQDFESKFFDPYPTLSLKDKKVSKAEKVAAASNALSSTSSVPKEPVQGQTEKKVPAPSSDDFKNEESSKKKNSWLWILLALLLLSIAAFLIFPLFMDVDKSTADTNHTSSKDSKVERKQINDSENEDAELIRQILEEEDTVIAEEPIIEKETISNKELESGEKKEITSTTPTAVKENKDIIQENDNQKSVHSLTTGDCIIIVGAFRNQKNVDKMKKRINKLGFESYSDIKGSLTRVGVKSSCDKSELKQNLKTCKQKIEAKSWIL